VHPLEPTVEPEPIEDLSEYIDKRMRLIEFSQDLNRAVGDAEPFAIVFKVISALFDEVGEVPSYGDVGFSGDIDIGPCFEVSHVGFDEQTTAKNSLEVSEADLAMSEWANADPTSLQLILEFCRCNSVRRGDDAVLASEALQLTDCGKAQRRDPAIGWDTHPATSVDIFFGSKFRTGLLEQIEDRFRGAEVPSQEDLLQIDPVGDWDRSRNFI